MKIAADQTHNWSPIVIRVEALSKSVGDVATPAFGIHSRSCLGRRGNQSDNRDARTGRGMGYNQAVDMRKNALNPWGERKRSARRYEEGGEGRV